MNLKRKTLEDYIPFVGEAEVERIRRLSRSLKGLRALHVNATAYGGGVAELLTSVLPLLNDLGLAAHWALLANLTGVHAFEVNCFQRAADVVIRKSIREGFGLVVSEGLWKRAAVVAGKVGGIPLQIQDGESGFLAAGTEEFSERIVRLLGDEALRGRFGENGREAVRERFLITRLVREELELYAGLTSG